MTLPSARAIEYGDTVDRHLIDGDFVVINRQPSLHRMSMMAHRAVIMEKGLTYRLHPCICKPYNADFDGDEMNMHVCQELDARVEMATLMYVTNCLVSEQSSKPVVELQQDILLGCWLLSREHEPILSYDLFIQLVSEANVDIDNDRKLQQFIDSCRKRHSLPTTRHLLLATLPDEFGIQTETLYIDRPSFMWFYGELTKQHCQWIIHRIWLDNGPMVARDTIKRMQSASLAYLQRYGFSIGYDDIFFTTRV